MGFKKVLLLGASLFLPGCASEMSGNSAPPNAGSFPKKPQTISEKIPQNPDPKIEIPQKEIPAPAPAKLQKKTPPKAESIPPIKPVAPPPEPVKEAQKSYAS